MSAIIAGKCKQCQGSYYISLGHPPWFDDRVKHNKDNAIYDSFDRLRKTGLCPTCGKTHYAQFAADWKKHSATPETTAIVKGESANGHRNRPRRQREKT